VTAGRLLPRNWHSPAIASATRPATYSSPTRPTTSSRSPSRHRIDHHDRQRFPPARAGRRCARKPVCQQLWPGPGNQSSTGATTVLAGTGQLGYGGDGGPATAAKFDFAADVALDAAGNIFVADEGNDVVREIDHATGLIHIIAGIADQAGYSGDGGSATSAKLNQPAGIAVDAADNVYIADADNNVVREVNFATGIITTVAGSGLAGFTSSGVLATNATLQQPLRVAVDPAGDLFISNNEQIISEVNHATGVLDTIGGPGSGTTGDSGPASAATFAAPLGLSLDVAGDLFVTDSSASRVRLITGGETVVTVSAPVAAVSGNGQPIADGAIVTSAANATDFGSLMPGNSITQTYSIANNGNSTLILGTVTIGGVAAVDFYSRQPAGGLGCARLEHELHNLVPAVDDWNSRRDGSIHGERPVPARPV